MSFFECLLQLVLLTCLPVFLLGLIAFYGKQICCALIGDEGRPLLQAFSVISTPLREVGHAIACLISLHRIEDMRLLDLGDPDGEWGFVEHSYNPKNPIAVLGNLLFVIGPVAVGLLAVLVICSTCFYGVWSHLLDEVAALGESGAGLGAYVGKAIALIPALFTVGEAPVALRILGCVLLMAICFGIYVSPAELKDAVGGLLLFTLLSAVVAVVLALLDDRLSLVVLRGLRSFCAGVIALFALSLAALCGLIVIGLLFRICCALFIRDTEDAA